MVYAIIQEKGQKRKQLNIIMGGLITKFFSDDRGDGVILDLQCGALLCPCNFELCLFGLLFKIRNGPSVFSDINMESS